MIENKIILAKSKSKGEVHLIDHLKSVSFFSQKFAEYLGLNTEIARFGGILHDIGKTSTQFQKVLFENILLPTYFRHEIVSIFFLKSIDKKYWDEVIDMIIAHHKSIENDKLKKGILDLIEITKDENEIFQYHIKDFENWKYDAINILKELGLNISDITEEDAHEAFIYAINHCINKKNGYSIWRGILMAADHYASAVYDHENNSKELFVKPDVSYYNNRKSIKYPLSLIESDFEKRHTFVKSPTGSGKTDFLLKQCQGRIFYTLPFQASINAMYERIKKDLEGVTNDIRLLHSASKIVIDDKNNTIEKLIQNKFGASIKVLTPHQLLSIVFGTKGYDIILDEIHTYSDEMQFIVLKLVEILNNIECRIHIGTATMPSVLETEIMKILGKENTQYVQLSDDDLRTFNRHIIYKALEFDHLIPKIQESIDKKEKILIVCNRVSNAQKTYEKIKKYIPDNIPKMLIHSRFKRKDRNKLERKLIDTFNKSNDACIVVSTQVIEVSLDISFDMMITECAPIDALIQRFGRINRIRLLDEIIHKKIYVISPPNNKKDSLPYDLEILTKSFEVLPNNCLLKETTLQSLIDAVYKNIKNNINIFGVFNNEKWILKELTNLSNSFSIDKLYYNSSSCIVESDIELYCKLSFEEKLMLEIPIKFDSVKYKNLRTIKEGTHPFIVPDFCYSEEKGLDLNQII